MKTLNLITVLAMLALAAGCRQTSQHSSNATAPAATGSSDLVQQARAKESRTARNYTIGVAPTSRNEGSADSRIYADNTTYAANAPAGTTVQDAQVSATMDAGTTADPAETKEPDNTGKNVRDRNDQTLTPGDQGTSESDREITRNIRRAIVGKELSINAKNIKIITTNGKVTLRGPVNNPGEKATILSVAKSVAGDVPVDDQLEVKTTTQNQ